MKLIAVPLARALPSSHPISTFVAKTAFRATLSAKDAQHQKPPLSSRIMQKASSFWIDMGRADKKSTLGWKKRTYLLGERLMDRIEYQEWALKAVDPALGPKHLDREPNPSTGQQDIAANKVDENSTLKTQTPSNIPLLYPPSLLSPNVLLTSLKNLTAHRTPHHYRRFWLCLAGMPVTLPFAFVPLIPNLPFFYLVYRAWSHWKAYKSSQYLSALLAQGRIEPTKSQELDAIFQTPSPPPLPPVQAEKQEADSVVPLEDERVILLPHHIDLLIDRLELPEVARADLRRARLQIDRSIQEDKLEQLENDAADSQPHDNNSNNNNKEQSKN